MFPSRKCSYNGFERKIPTSFYLFFFRLILHTKYNNLNHIIDPQELILHFLIENLLLFIIYYYFRFIGNGHNYVKALVSEVLYLI